MAQQSSDQLFTLKTETVEVPLIVTPDALADFREHGLEAMNEVLAHMAARNGVAADRHHAQKDLVADMMFDGLASDNTRKLVLCALWLAHHFPTITGLVRHGSRFYFIDDAVQSAIAVPAQ